MVWALARDELRKMNSYTTPGDKIACVVSHFIVATNIHLRNRFWTFYACLGSKRKRNIPIAQSCASKDRGKLRGLCSRGGRFLAHVDMGGDGVPRASTLLQLWIYRKFSRPSKSPKSSWILFCELAVRLTNASSFHVKLMALSCSSAIEFIMNVDSSSLSIDPTEFASKLEAAEKEYEKSIT